MSSAEQHIVTIKQIEKVTHNVNRYVVEKPMNYLFTPGQATEVSINKEGWKEERRPFTFTNLPTDPELEFTIKSYSDHPGVTNQLLSLTPGDQFIVHDVWGAIAYKGEGTFIAGGAGITPFLSIFRWLKTVKEIGKNKLIFANSKREDIIHEQELKTLLGDAFINILSNDNSSGYDHGFLNEQYLKAHISSLDKHFYVCGPPPMMEVVQQSLTSLGVGDQSVVVEL